LLKRPMRIHSIRGGRPKPGLGHQHSTGAKLVADICCGMLKPESVQYGGHCEGVTELYLWPGRSGLQGGEFHADPHTAGSITLLLQASLPCALIGARPADVIMNLRGGTNVSGSPSIDFIPMCLFPSLTKFGIPAANMKVEIKKRGFYPLGNGEVKVHIKPVTKGIQPITMLERGLPKSIQGIVYASGTGRKIAKEAIPWAKGALETKFASIPIQMIYAPEPEGEAASATPAPQSGKQGKQEKPQKKGFEKEEKKPLTMKERKALQSERDHKFSGVAGCQLIMETTTGCLFSGSSLIQDSGKGSSGVISPKEVGETAAKMLISSWEAGGCLDEYLMDQLIVFMAAAQGTSKVLCPGKTEITSEHLQTAIHFVELLFGTKIVIGEPGPNGERVIECAGIGLI